MRVDHDSLVLTYLWFQVEQFDVFYEEKHAVNTELAGGNSISHGKESRYTATVPSPRTSNVIILGSEQKVFTIWEPFEKQKMDSAAFTGFCSCVSLTIQALSSEPVDMIAINDSHQV